MLPDCEICKKLIKRDLLYLHLYLRAENEVFKCSYKAQIPSLNSLFFSSLKYYLDGTLSLKDLYKVTTGVLAQLILGKKKVSEMRSKRGIESFQNIKT